LKGISALLSPKGNFDEEKNKVLEFGAVDLQD
jgi:hypothetical protein